MGTEPNECSQCQSTLPISHWHNIPRHVATVHNGIIDNWKRTYKSNPIFEKENNQIDSRFHDLMQMQKKWDIAIG